MFSPEESLSPSKKEIKDSLMRLFNTVRSKDPELVRVVEKLSELKLSGVAWQNLKISMIQSHQLTLSHVDQIQVCLKVNSKEQQEQLLADYLIEVKQDWPDQIPLVKYLSAENFVHSLKVLGGTESFYEDVRNLARKIEDHQRWNFEERQELHLKMIQFVQPLESLVDSEHRDYLLLAALRSFPVIGEKTGELIKILAELGRLHFKDSSSREDFYAHFLGGGSDLLSEHNAERVSQKSLGLERLLSENKSTQLTQLVRQIVDSETPVTSLYHLICVLSSSLPDVLQEEATRDELLFNRNEELVNALSAVGRLARNYIEGLLDLGGANWQRVSRIAILSGGKLAEAYQLNSSYHQLEPEDLTLLSLAERFPDIFAEESVWPARIKEILDYQERNFSDDLNFRLKLYGVLNDEFKRVLNQEESSLETPLDYLEIELLMRERKDLNNYLNYQIILQETVNLRNDFNVQKVDFIENLVKAMLVTPVFELSIIANCLICMVDENLRTYLGKRLLELPDNHRADLVYEVTTGYLDKQLTNLLDSFLNSESLERFVMYQYGFLSFGGILGVVMISAGGQPGTEEFQSRTYSKFVNADQLPRSDEVLATEMRQELGASFRRMYQDYQSFGALTYDARGPEPVLAEFGQAVYQSAERIHSADRNSYLGKGFKFSNPNIKRLFVLEKGSQPLIKYQESWPWLAESLENYSTSKSYLTRAFKAFANPGDSRLTIEGIDYAYLVFNEHHLNYSGKLAFLVPVQILDSELSPSLVALNKMQKNTDKLVDSKEAQLTPERLVALGEQLGQPVYNVGCGSSFTGGFGNVFRKYVADNSPLSGFINDRLDLWGVPHKEFDFEDPMDIIDHRVILAAVEAGQGYSDLFNLTLANFHKGQVVGNLNPYYMIEKAVGWHDALRELGAERETFPVLYLADSLDTRQAPFAYFTLDTYDMILRDRDGKALGIYDETTTVEFKTLWSELVTPALSTATDLRFYDRRTIRELVPFDLDRA